MIIIVDDVVIVCDKEKIRNLLGRTKREILSVLSEEELSCKEIADRLDKTRSTIYRHIKKLQESNFVEIKREEKVDQTTKKIYGKTADLFLPLPQSMEADKPTNVSVRWDEESTGKILKVLSDIGFDIENEEVTKRELVYFFKEMDGLVKNLLKENDGFDDLDMFSILRLKLLILISEIQNDDEVRKRCEDICSKFRG